MNLPKHACSLSLEHNPHKVYYEDIEYWIRHNDIYDWKDLDSKNRSIATNEVWTLHWYPNTPVGFNSIAAPTLEELIDLSQHPDQWRQV